jgi:hypothetical protein
VLFATVRTYLKVWSRQKVVAYDSHIGGRAKIGDHGHLAILKQVFDFAPPNQI